MGLLPDTENCGLRMRRECRERFSHRFSRVSDPDMHHGTCVTLVSWCMPGSLLSGFLWSRWRGKCSRHCRRRRNPQFYVSGKRPIGKCSPNVHLIRPPLLHVWYRFTWSDPCTLCYITIDPLSRHQVRNRVLYYYIWILSFQFSCKKQVK